MRDGVRLFLIAAIPEGGRVKILFSNPPWWQRRDEGGWLAGVRAGSRWPFLHACGAVPDAPVQGEYLPQPLFMAHAASYAQARVVGTQVAYRDSIALRESYGAFLRHVAGERYDALVVESSSPSWEHDRHLLRTLRGMVPGMRVAVAGPVTVTRAEEIVGEELAHAAIQGEYEKGTVRFLEGESGIIAPDLLAQDEMDCLPLPWLDEFGANRYWDANPAGQRQPQLQMWSSRGCPYRCIFCVWPATMTGHDSDGIGKRLVRQHSGEYVEALVQDRCERFGVRCVYFDDDTFNLGDRHTLAMCEAMARVGLPWSAMCRADTVKPDTWAVMRQTGCFGVKIGFESGSQWVVDHIVNKRLDLEKARETVVLLKRLGFTVHGTFTIGLPGETREQMLETFRYRESLPLDTWQVSGAAEIEGTPLHAMRASGRLVGVVESDGVAKAARLGAELAL